jgi:hypothetical protein
MNKTLLLTLIFVLISSFAFNLCPDLHRADAIAGAGLRIHS